MASVNTAIVLGNVGRAPELRSTPSGKQVCEFSVATTEKFKGGESTEWHTIVCWEKLAELCAKYLDKGKQVYVEGRLATRTWEKDGFKHYKTEIIASKVVFLGPKGEQKTGAEPSTDEMPF